MDIATIIGILVGLGCVVVGVIADGGDFGLFFCIPAITIVAGGTLAATCVHFSWGQVMKMMSVVKQTLIYKLPSEQELIQKMVNYSA